MNKRSFESFVQVAVTDSHTRHQDFVSPCPPLVRRLLELHLEHDLEEISNVSEELDPGEMGGGGALVRKVTKTCVSRVNVKCALCFISAGKQRNY